MLWVNLDVIKITNYIIDHGPKGGGEVIAPGSPEEITHNGFERSCTAKYLKQRLAEEVKYQYYYCFTKITLSLKSAVSSAFDATNFCNSNVDAVIKTLSFIISCLIKPGFLLSMALI